MFPWELTFHGRYKPAVVLQLKISFWEVCLLVWACTAPCVLLLLSCRASSLHSWCHSWLYLQTMQHLIQRLKQPKENSESIERGRTYSKVQCNLKYILWSKLHVGLMSVITSLEVFSSMFLTPHYPAVLGRRGMAAAMHCVSGRNILIPQPFPWSSWCHPLSCHFPFAFGSCHRTNKSGFSGNLCSVAWANSMGPWGHSATLWLLPVGMCQDLWASELCNVSTGWWALLLYFSWSTCGAARLKTFLICSWKMCPDAVQLLCAISVHMDLVMATSVPSSAMASAWRAVQSRCNSGQVPFFPLWTSPLSSSFSATSHHSAEGFSGWFSSLLLGPANRAFHVPGVKWLGTQRNHVKD